METSEPSGHRHAGRDIHPVLAEKSESPARIEALSDGLFAVALTLLVLDIHVPAMRGSMSNHEVKTALLSQLPQITVFVASFFIVGYFWVSHNLMFSSIERSDRILMWLNLGHLLCIAFLPFSTAFVSQYHAYAIAAIAYGINLLFCSLSMLAVWLYASHDNALIHADVPQSTKRSIIRRLLIAPSVLLLAIAVAFVNPLLSLLLYLATPIYYISTAVRRSLVDEL